MTMARRPSTAESVPVTANKPDHIIISLALYASASRRATNRSWRLPRRNHASNRSGRRWRGCRSPETVSGTTAGNSKSVNRPRGSARSQLQLSSRRPNHQKRPHLSSLDSRHAPYRTNHEQNVKGHRLHRVRRAARHRDVSGAVRQVGSARRGTAPASAREPKVDGALGSRSKSDAGPCATRGERSAAQPGGAAIEICFRISRSGFSS
jgi:hypothetical protein